MRHPAEDAALRAATTSSQYEKALSAALDRLAATPSVPETQRLLDALFQPHQQGPKFLDLLPRLKPVVSVCTTPQRKAECVGHTLIENLVLYVVSTVNHPEAMRASQETLLSVFQANPAIVGGVLTALEGFSRGTDHITAALVVTRPLLVASLIEAASQRSVFKLAIIQTLVRMAWASTTTDLRTPIVHVFVRAVERSPLSSTIDAWTVYPALVASTVDLVTSEATGETSATGIAHAVLRRVVYGLTHELSVVSLLQSLEELVNAWPRVLCTSSIVCQLGVVLLNPQSVSREKTLVLRILRALLATLKTTPRNVYVEVLLVPLVAVQATHPQEAGELLHLVLKSTVAAPFQKVDDRSNGSCLGVDAAHVASFLALAASTDACEAWLQTLFHDKNPEIHDPSSTLLIQLGACLVDRRGKIRMLTLDALDRQVQTRRIHKNADWSASQIKLLVSTLVNLTSYRPASAAPTDQECLNKSFQVLASLAATRTETMKIILRLIKRMAMATPILEPQALHLMLLVWKQDSRVYPQLENMLNQAKVTSEKQDDSEDDDAVIVRMATILAMCEKDPETGVEWISDIQAFLEHDCVSIVTMAVRAVTLLCIADCLDYETTAKLFVVKIKKNKISCADDTLFQQEMCKFYAFGGACGFVESSPKYSARVLSDLWEYTEADDAKVRFAAFTALNNYTLEALGLAFVDSSSANGPDDDEESDDELTEQDVIENVDRVWTCLQTERDENVRHQIENLVKKILEAESKKLAPGGAGRTGTNVSSVASFALEQRVSAAATKELKKQLPSRQIMVGQVDQAVHWCAYLMAYEPENAVESAAAAKRRDKRLRAVMGQVEEMKAVLTTCLASSSATGADGAKLSPVLQFLTLLQAVDAWNSFARKYFGRLEELAVLRTPMDAPDGHTEGVLSTLIDEQNTSLIDEATTHTQKWLIVGAILHQASLSASSNLLKDTITKFRAVLRAQLLQSMEELRVFKDAKHAVEVQHVLLGLVLAYPTEWETHLDALLVRVQSVVNNEGSYLMRAAAVLFVSHFSSLFHEGESRSEQHQRFQLGIECALTMILRPTRSTFATGMAAKVLAGSFKAADLSKTTSSTDGSNKNIVVAWASAMGLAWLSHRLAAVHRLDWLDKLRMLFETVWIEDPTLFGAVALGPILVESVRHNRVSLAEVKKLMSRLQQGLNDAPANVVVIGAMAFPYVLQHITAYGYVSAQEDVKIFVQSLDSGCSSAPVLAVATGNLLHGSTGVTLFGATTIPEREVIMDATTVQYLTTALNALQKETEPVLSVTAAFSQAAIVDRVDSFVVVQKNKTFDAQINTLPATSLMFKVLEYLRVDPAAPIDISVKKASQSVLRCVAHASGLSPLPFDLSALAIRVTSRYATADDILIACIDLAASHASAINLIMSNLLSPDRLLNYSPLVMEACVDAIARSLRRLTSEQVVLLLTRLYNVLVECWRRDDASPVVSTAFGNMITFLGSLVETAAPKEGDVRSDVDGESIDSTVGSVVLKQFVPKLPFTPKDEMSKPLLRQLAQNVLSKLKDHHSTTDALVASTSQPDEEWSWWRIGSLLFELLRLGCISSSSVVFRWLLQLDFSHIERTTVLEAFMADAADAICVASTKRPPIETNEPWLLELLDAVAQTQDSELKRSVLFATVENVLSWKEVRGHELFILSGDAEDAHRKTIAQSLPALVAQALLRHHHERSNASMLLAERLWTLNTSSDEVADTRATVVKELYVIASDAKLRLLSNDTEKALGAQLSIE